MKKVTCIIGIVCIGMFLAFGQTADTAAEPPDTGPRLEAADTETPAQTADNAVDTAGHTAANPANTDTKIDSTADAAGQAATEPASADTKTGSAGAEMPSVENARTEATAVPAAEAPVAETPAASTAAAPAKDSVVVVKDAVPAQHVSVMEMNEPTMRTKARLLSMHSGIMFSGIAANNIFSVTDFFQKELIIDLNKLAKNTIRTGLHGGAAVGFDWFFRFTVQETHTIKLSTTVDVNAWANIPKSLLKLAAEGNPENAKGKDITGTFNAKINAFADTGIMYQLNKPDYDFSARLAYFVPIAYMENPQATYSISPKKNEAGITGLTVKAKGNMALYGHLPALGFGQPLSIPDLFKNGGVDLSLAGSYQLTKWAKLTAGIDHLPLMVVTMDKGIRADFEFEGELNGLLNDTLGSLIPSSSAADSSKKSTQPFKQTMKTNGPTAEGLPKKKIMRPGKIRIGADFKPFENNYLILSPFLAFPFINATPYYIDGGLRIESRFAKVLGAYLDSSCVERIWRHELGLLLDSRGFTLTLAASIASHDFTRTFHTLSGFGIKFGAGIGF
nr:hypothetical protein [uncultured Treponema sp.]